jgi:CelD/BcsL family acetyltransferase involved in cellulose biosynthesis
MDFIAQKGREEYVFTELLEYLEKIAWRSFELDSLLPQSLTLKYFVPLARQKGYQIEIKQMNVSPQLVLPSSWEDYLGSLKTKDRHELRRKLRRLEQAQSVNYLTIIEKSLLLPAMETFFKLFQLSNTEKANFMTDKKREFFTTMVSSLGEKGNIRLSFMEANVVRISATLCFDYHNDIYLYNSAYDPDYSSLSVSLLLKAFNISEAINRRKKRFDFLSGNEPYKYDLGGQDVPLYQCVITRS